MLKLLIRPRPCSSPTVKMVMHGVFCLVSYPAGYCIREKTVQVQTLGPFLKQHPIKVHIDYIITLEWNCEMVPVSIHICKAGHQNGKPITESIILIGLTCWVMWHVHFHIAQIFELGAPDLAYDNRRLISPHFSNWYPLYCTELYGHVTHDIDCNTM